MVPEAHIGFWIGIEEPLYNKANMLGKTEFLKAVDLTPSRISFERMFNWKARWHTYMEQMGDNFDAMVQEFSETVGAKEGIAVSVAVEFNTRFLSYVA